MLYDPEKPVGEFHWTGYNKKKGLYKATNGKMKNESQDWEGGKKKKKSLNNMIDGNELLKTLLTRFLWCNKRNKLNTIWQWFLSFLAQGSPKL